MPYDFRKMGVGPKSEAQLYSKIQDLIDSGKGDIGRLKFIQKCLRNDKKLYNSDQKYLEKILTPTELPKISLDSKNDEILLALKTITEWRLGDVARLQYIHNAIKKHKQLPKSDTIYLENKLKTLSSHSLIGPKLASISHLEPEKTSSEEITIQIHKCKECNNELKFEEPTIRKNSNWYHLNCIPREVNKKPPVSQVAKHDTNTKPTKKQKSLLDPLQILLAVGIFATLISTAYFMLSSISMIAMAIGASLALYQFLSARNLDSSKFEYKKKIPSSFFLIILILPFVLGTVLAIDGYQVWESPLRIIILWGLVVTFWSTMLFVPVSIYSKYKENLIPEPSRYPRVSILVPAYNEEKVIAKTIEGLLDTDYPDKEIIVIDDGSTDNTLSIAKQFKEKAKILTKSNSGKATALNYGLNFVTGEIVVVVDADTIIGRHSLRHLVKGFEVDKRVAAVAGNIKVRNRINWITKCQAIEYIAGIQIVRRAFDLFGAINIVPGALGAFRKEAILEAGAYHKDTIVEDFDATIKILKSGLIVQGTTSATAYTEAPQSIMDFIKQRKRWNRGNIQVLTRHSDAVSNPRFGNLHKLAFPFMIISMLILPVAGFLVVINSILAVLTGDGLFVGLLFLMFITLQFLLTALAIRIDDDDKHLLTHSIFMVIGFKQLVDILLIRAILEQIFKRKATWTSAKRIGV